MKPRREGLLPVIGIVSMLTQVVFIQQFVLHRRELRRKLAREQAHIGTLFQPVSYTHLAATVLGIAQANVSKYLADFESKVGLKVFDRTTRQLMLTPFGTALLPYINDMLDRNEQLNNFIADYKHEKRGRVTIYAPTRCV